MALTTADSGNILVRNYGRNPAVNFNFMLRVEGVYDLPCKAVHSFQRENEYEYIQEGGLNDYVHMRRKPISKPFTFQVERYVGTDILDPLSLGTDLALPIILIVNRYLIYGDFVPIRSYIFTGCTVMAKQYGELDAEKSGLLVETTTIAYREMFCMENVAGSFLMEEPWGFDGQKMEGRNEQHARHPQNEVRMKDMPSKKWVFANQASDAELESNEAMAFRGFNGSGVYNAGEVRRKEMEEAAKLRKWPPKKNAVDVATFLSKDAGTGIKQRIWPPDQSAVRIESHSEENPET